jgi:hypothetical protein
VAAGSFCFVERIYGRGRNRRAQARIEDTSLVELDEQLEKLRISLALIKPKCSCLEIFLNGLAGKPSTLKFFRDGPGCKRSREWILKLDRSDLSAF